MPDVSRTIYLEQAGNDAPRTALGTVPGTVPGVTRVGVCGWTSLAISERVPAARGGRIQRRTRGRMPAVIGDGILQPTRVGVRTANLGANCRGIFGRSRERTCVAALTASSEETCERENRGQSQGGGTSTERREERVADVSPAPVGAGQSPLSLVSVAVWG
jgi:hypothetical protein